MFTAPVLYPSIIVKVPKDISSVNKIVSLTVSSVLRWEVVAKDDLCSTKVFLGGG